MTAPLDDVAEAISLIGVLDANTQDRIELTDSGSGRRFALLYQDILRYVADVDKWVVRTGNHWSVDTSRLAVFALTRGVTRSIREEAALPHNDDEVREALLGYALKTEAEGLRYRIINSSRENVELVIKEDDLDAGLNMIATPSGMVDLITGEFRESRPDDLCTLVTKVDYDPKAKSLLLDQYLNTFVPDPEDQWVLFAVLGTILRGGNPGRLFPIFIGGTTSGKSQLIAALDNLLGGYMCSINASVFRGNLDDKPRPDLVRAMHKRIAYAVEASKIWELHSDQVKRITGGDSVPYRDLYEGSVEKIPRFTPLIVTNDMPRIKGADAALRRRLIVVPFDKTLPPELEDTRIKERFIHDEECLKALLARIVEGARHPALRDGIKWSLLPQRYAEGTMASFSQLDHVAEFIEWLTDREVMQVTEPNTPVSHCARVSELHEWYAMWIKKHGDKQDKAESLNLQSFNAALEERGWVKKASGGLRWVGVKLTQQLSLWGI